MVAQKAKPVANGDVIQRNQPKSTEAPENESVRQAGNRTFSDDLRLAEHFPDKLLRTPGYRAQLEIGVRPRFEDSPHDRLKSLIKQIDRSGDKQRKYYNRPVNYHREIHMRYVVSGAAGFIGSHLCDRLLENGHSVVAIDNLITGHTENIAHLTGHLSFAFIEADVCQPVAVSGPVDRVFHLASLASPVDYLNHPLETLESGSTGTRNMLELARNTGARFLVTSTSECYGDPLEHPQTETYWGNVNPVGLRSCYDESKRYAEAITMAYHRVYGLKTNIARIFNTYGPRMALNDGRVVPAFIDHALRGAPLTVFGDGSQTRSFCFVSDLVEGLLLLSESDERLPVNLGNPVEMTILQFANEIRGRFENAVGIEYLPLPSDDPKLRRPDITKARNLLGWEPKVALGEGLSVTIDYFKNKESLTAA
jgi:dTDP-glucose 4,6-dehydratase